MSRRAVNQNHAATDAPKGKGGEAVARAAQIQDYAMLKVAERPSEGKEKKVVAPKFHTVSSTRRAAQWLDEMNAGGVNTVVADLTPDIAAVLMERNPGNRKLKAAKVQDYAKDMAQGSWKFNGEPIIISSDGLLNDGQHRAAAVIESRATIKALMVFGVDRDTRDTLDQGVNRQVGDYLSMHGYTDTNHVASAARMLWQWRTFGTTGDGSTMRPTRNEVMQTVFDNPGIVKSLHVVSRKTAHSFGSLSVLAFCHFAFKVSSDEYSATFFFDALIDGAGLERGDPILNIRNRLITDRKVLRNPQKVELLFRAWNAHRLGVKRTLFRVVGGELPLLEA